MVIKIIILALIGALIGWITNKVAIKMLFKPIQPIKILFFELQGVFPKRQKAIAKSLGKVVEKDLVGIEDLKNGLLNNENITLIKEKLKNQLSKIIKDNVPAMVLAMAGQYINQIIEKFMSDENNLIEDIAEELFKSNKNFKISKIVEDKVNNMDFGMFENILLELIAKELKFIEYIGAVLGLIIGIFQGLIVVLF